MNISRFIRLTGIITIFASIFCAIFISFFTREIANDFPGKKYYDMVSSVEERFYDYRMIPHLKDSVDKSDLVFLALDDESLQKIHSWPIPRENWATLLKNLKSYGAKVIAFDVLFPEPVQSCSEISPDTLLNQAINDFQSVEGNSVILAYTVQDKGVSSSFFDEVPEELYANMSENKIHNEDSTFSLKQVEKNTWPIPELLKSEPGLGFLNMEEDADGKFRHYQLVANVDGLFFPSLALKSYMSFTETNPTIEVENNRNGNVPFGKDNLSLNSNGETKIRWINAHKAFKTISLHKPIYAKENDPELTKIFKDKIVFIGSTATGAHDLRNTPIDSKLPGVFAHMNMTHMLLNNFFYNHQEDSINYSYYIYIVSYLILMIVMYFNRPILDVAALFSIIAVVYYLDSKFFLPEGYEIRLSYNFIALVSSYSWLTFLNFQQANSEKKMIKGAFSRYVAPSIVDDMLDHPDKLKVGGERKDITCMFSDVRDFTSISERLTATQLSKSLNRYMGEMTDIVFATNGTLDKYIGDAIVAFWGAPIDIGDHVNQAVDAGVKMLEALPAINAEFKAQDLPEFKIGLGLNSGECNVGNMGSDQIFAYTALGDNMNLGARLESLCKHYGAQILISEYTFDRMDQQRFQTRIIDRVRVKGKTQPVGVYEVLYNYHPFVLNPELLPKFKEAYQKYLDMDFQGAIDLFDEILKIIPEDKASNRLKESSQNWLENPPGEDDDHTITTMTTK